MGRPVIVAVQKQQPLALGGLDAGIARGGQPAVRAVDDRNAGAKLSKSITHGGAGIRGAIVHQDALPVRRAGLLHHAFDAGRKISLHIIHRHNDRKCDVSCAFHRSCFLYFVGINVQSWSYRAVFLPLAYQRSGAITQRPGTPASHCPHQLKVELLSTNARQRRIRARSAAALFAPVL